MNKSIIILLVVVIGAALVGLVLLMDREAEEVEYTLEDARTVATEWMEEESPTYTYDGSDLAVVDEQEIDDITFEFTFEFESAAAGFGDRTDEMVAQVITPHSTVVVVEENEVVSAITDGVFSELDGEMIEENGEQNGEDPVDQETVSVYFITVDDGQESVVAVDRLVTADDAMELSALEALLAGPTDEESAAGYSTSINEGVSVNQLSIDNGVATVDFSAELNEGVAGSATVMAIREQIENTLLQFDLIDEVVISVEGETEEILQP